MAVIEVICFCLIFLFVYAAISKLLAFERFSIQIGQSKLLTRYSVAFAWGIPIVELIISLMLAISRLRLIGLYAAFTLMVLFTGYIIFILTSDDRIPCSCGGVLELLGWKEHMLFNICFVILSSIAIILQSNTRTMPMAGMDGYRQ